MKYLFAFIVFPIFLGGFKRGEGTTYLTCKSQSGRTLFEAEFAEYTVLRKAKIKIDKDSILFDDDDECTVVFDPETKVYTLNIESEKERDFGTHCSVQLWAIPATFTEESPMELGIQAKYTFTAKIIGKDPRKEKKFEMPLILLNCTMTYTGP